MENDQDKEQAIGKAWDIFKQANEERLEAIQDNIPPVKRIPVMEIFGPVLEGEGSFAGKQTFFIRFGLCDYKCKKCDSMHAVDPKLVKLGAQYLTEDEIFQALTTLALDKHASHIKTVTFSGGNPAVHNLMRLVKLLRNSEWKILVETQGTLQQDWLFNVSHICVSPKAPGMGEKFEPNRFLDFIATYASMGMRITLKIVIFSAQDLEFAAGVAGLLQDQGFGNSYIGFNLERDFYLSLGNDQPPKFALTTIPGQDTAQITDTNLTSRKTLVEDLLSRYNILSEQMMKDYRLPFARFLPQLHVLTYGNETGR